MEQLPYFTPGPGDVALYVYVYFLLFYFYCFYCSILFYFYFNKFYTELSSNIFNCETDDPVNTFNALKEFTESKISKTEPFIINAITELEVFQMLIKLNVNKSAGVDTIGPHILKLSANIISKPIAHMINLSIATGKFPEKLKVAKVTPIYKKAINLTLVITDLFLYCQQHLSFLSDM